jgi:hypothetical protein
MQGIWWHVQIYVKNWATRALRTLTERGRDITLRGKWYVEIKNILIFVLNFELIKIEYETTCTYEKVVNLQSCDQNQEIKFGSPDELF